MNDHMTFEDILKLKPTEIKKPKVLPQGQYTAIVQGMPTYGEIPTTGTRTLEFTLSIVAPHDEGTTQAIADADFGNVSGRSIRHTFFEGDDVGFYLGQFMIHLGLDKGDLNSRIAQSANREVGIVVKHNPSKTRDGDVFPRISKTFALKG